MANFLSGLGRAIQDAGKTYLSVREAERERKRQEMLDARQQKLIDLQLAQAALEGLEPGAELDAETTALISKTPLSSRLNRENTLPSRQFSPNADGGFSLGPTVGGSRVTLKPTFAQREAMALRDERVRQQQARESLAQEYLKSEDPVLRSFGQALQAGLNEAPPVPFDVQKQRAKELGEIENEFALKRIREEMSRYGSPEDQKRFRIFMGAFQAGLREGMSADEAMKVAENVASFYLGEGIAESLQEEETAPGAEDPLGIKDGPSFMDRLRSVPGAVRKLPGAVRNFLGPNVSEAIGLDSPLDDTPSFRERWNSYQNWRKRMRERDPYGLIKGWGSLPPVERMR